MQSCHAAAAVDVAFDEPNLIADAGLVPVVALAERIGLPDLVTERVRIGGAANSAGANPAAKVLSLLAGMVAGADSIADVDRLRHAGNEVAFGQIRAPSSLGSFLRAFTFGHIRQLDAVAAELNARPRKTLEFMLATDLLNPNFPKMADSYGIAGVRGRAIICNTPGSPKGCVEQLGAILSASVAYGLLAARCWEDGELDRRTVYERIPPASGILRDVFRYISLSPPPEIEWIIDDLVDLLRLAGIVRVQEPRSPARYPLRPSAALAVRRPPPARSPRWDPGRRSRWTTSWAAGSRPAGRAAGRTA